MTPTTLYCWNRMGFLLQQFLREGGYGDIVECSYLTYLEIAEVAEGRSGVEVWLQWNQRVEELTGSVRPLNRFLGTEDAVARQTIAQHLREFAARFGPDPFNYPAESVGDTEPFQDGFEFLLGEWDEP